MPIEWAVIPLRALIMNLEVTTVRKKLQKVRLMKDLC